MTDDPNNWPAKFGFICKPEKMIGKTIASVKHVQMEYGCTHRSALFIRFEDGSRGFLLASDASQCLPSPSLESMREAEAYTPDEVAEIVRSAEARRQANARRERERKLADLARLKKECGVE